MPKFEHAPPDTSRQSGLRLIRTPAAKPLVLVLSCQRLIGCATHWYANRTVPCEAPGCDPCDEGYPWRWHAYLTGIDPSSLEHVIIEFTARAIDPLDEYFRRHKTMRGCIIQATRASAKSNGRVLIRCKPADLAKIDLPKEPNIPKLLCHIWGLPEDAVYQRADPDGRDRIKLNKDAPSAVHHAPTPPLHMHDPGDNGEKEPTIPPG